MASSVIPPPCPLCGERMHLEMTNGREGGPGWICLACPGPEDDEPLEAA